MTKPEFGETAEGFAVPVLNEREIRAAAGIMFLALALAFVYILFKQDFLLVKYVILSFFTDFAVRVFISPRFSPLLVIGRLIVSRQVPEYVGAAQKAFAWRIGFVLSATMFVLLVVLNSYSSITLVTCLACLLLLFCESAFGICLACGVYSFFYKAEALHCAGAVCAAPAKQPIQKTSRVQLLVLASFLLCLSLAVAIFNNKFRAAPKNLKDIIEARLAN